MFTFLYPEGEPDNSKELEKLILEKYSEIEKQYPQVDTTFTMMAGKWQLSTPLQLGVFYGLDKLNT